MSNHGSIDEHLKKWWGEVPPQAAYKQDVEIWRFRWWVPSPVRRVWSAAPSWMQIRVAQRVLMRKTMTLHGAYPAAYREGIQ